MLSGRHALVVAVSGLRLLKKTVSYLKPPTHCLFFSELLVVSDGMHAALHSLSYVSCMLLCCMLCYMWCIMT
jgi:hypothetical protein